MVFSHKYERREAPPLIIPRHISGKHRFLLVNIKNRYSEDEVFSLLKLKHFSVLCCVQDKLATLIFRGVDLISHEEQERSPQAQCQHRIFNFFPLSSL